jgi:hypothetical protein
VRFLGPVPFDALRASLGHISAPPLNPFELSVHERIFFALGGGVVPIFDANCFSKRYMPQLERFSFLQSLGDQPSSELR